MDRWDCALLLEFHSWYVVGIILARERCPKLALQLGNRAHLLYVVLSFLTQGIEVSLFEQIKQFSTQNGNSLTWNADLASGSSLCVFLYSLYYSSH